MKRYNVGIIGVTGLVGNTLLKVLDEYNFPINELFLCASGNSIGQKIFYKDELYLIEELKEEVFVNLDIAFFCAGNDVAEKWCMVAEKYKTLIIDNSSHFRMDDDIALIVPEININDYFGKRSIIANPNCSTIQSVICLNALKEYGLKKVIYNTYQAVSGSGISGINDLLRTQKGLDTQFYPYNINKTCIPHIDQFTSSRYTKEELKMIDETKKILNEPNLLVTATCVRVPVLFSHAVSITVELDKEVEIKDIIEAFKRQESLVVVDDIDLELYPTSIIATNTDNVYVGRIRKVFDNDKIYSFYCVADNIRRGAASNAVLTALKILKINEIKSIA